MFMVAVVSMIAKLVPNGCTSRLTEASDGLQMVIITVKFVMPHMCTNCRVFPVIHNIISLIMVYWAELPLLTDN